jgi:hypothetical protein
MRAAVAISVYRAPSFTPRFHMLMKDTRDASCCRFTDLACSPKMYLLAHTLFHPLLCTRTSVTRDAIEERCQLLRESISRTKSDYEAEKLAERLAKLSGGVAVIKVSNCVHQYYHWLILKWQIHIYIYIYV